MDRAAVQARVNRGLGVAAGVLGGRYSVYRPDDPMRPWAGLVATIQAAVAQDADGAARRPAGFGATTRVLLADAGGLQVGDLIAGEGETYFLAALPAGMAPLLVECNASLQLAARAASAGYGGVSEQVAARDWPASLRLSGRGGSDAAGLPEGRSSGWQVLMARPPGVAVTSGMRAVDGGGVRYVFDAVETSALGLRIAASHGGG